MHDVLPCHVWQAIAILYVEWSAVSVGTNTRGTMVVANVLRQASQTSRRPSGCVVVVASWSSVHGGCRSWWDLPSHASWILHGNME